MILFGPVPSTSESFLQVVVLVGFGLFGIWYWGKDLPLFRWILVLGKHESNAKKEKRTEKQTTNAINER
ncbi:hypothetical protein [Haladaptatus cibarius]|uniref:hypothetical protein n=1 Tax=Haladaptatus cibarius TaxID=453847 RepID=UPI000679B95C|nr:hypothetical protein [Haladaptatus cibarius]